MKNKEAIPPKWADKLLELVCANDQLEIIQGDLYELYAMRLASHSRLYANLYFIKDVIDLIVRPFIWKSRKSVYPSGSMAIYNNYLKVGFRNILKHKGYSFLNISGLSVGLCSFLLIFLFVYDEWSYDRYHDNASEIYRVTVKEHDLSDNVVGHYSYASPRQAPMLKENLPEVIEAVRFYPWNFPVISHEDKEFQENTFVFAEQSIFDIFSFNFIEGNAQTALVDPNTVVTTKSTAEKYFGDHSALGKRVNYKGFAGEERLLEVTGVVEDFPEQSHIDHAFIGSFVTLESTGRSGEFDDYIGNYNYPSYVKVAKEPDSKILASKIPNLLDQYIGQVGDRKASDKIRIYLQPLTDIHLGIGLPGGAGSTGNAFYVYLFTAIGLIILLIACLNYVNLSTSKYSVRLKEIGVRKALGAQRHQVSRQFFSESFLLVFISMLLAIILANLCLPFVNTFTGKTLTLNLFEQAWLALPMFGLLLLVGLLSGIYPAVFMSRMHSSSALKSRSKPERKPILRSTLVVFQFVVTIALILAVISIDKQIRFINDKDLGYNRDQIVHFYITPSVVNKLEAFKNELLQNANVLSVSASSRIPTESLGDIHSASLPGKANAESLGFKLPFVRIDKDYFDTYDVDMVTGRSFKDNPTTDQTHYIINQKAASMMGWPKVEEAIGQPLKYNDQSGKIVGVVQDFNFESVYSPLEPIIFIESPKYRRLSIKINAQNFDESLQHIENISNEFMPDRDFSYAFLSETYRELYKSEEQLSDISKVFSGLAVIIAVLGLLGLVSFHVERRSKEITIRKVLGASSSSILWLISKHYLLLGCLAFTLAVPLGYYFIDRWLDSFAYRTTPGAESIIYTALLIMALALTTLSYQTLRAAFSNPAENLKSEE